MTATATDEHAGHNWPREDCPACIAQGDERPVYRRGDGLRALIALQLWIARHQDPDHCSICGRHLGMWFYGFPFPYCCWCIDRIRREPRLCCPPRRKEPCQREECRRETVRTQQ